MLASQAIVAIDRPDRWAKQLVSHFSHKVSVEPVADGSLIHFDAGDGLVSTTDWAVVLTASAATEVDVAKVQDVLARHLERFAAAQAVTVVWGEAAQLD